MRITSIIIYLFLLFLNLPLSAQLNQYRFSRIDISKGLSNNEVNCIFKDENGFLWFGTRSGFDRFDGYKFKVFKHDLRDTFSISDEEVEQIFEGPQHKLWISEARSGYFENNGKGQFTFHPFPIEAQEAPVNAIICTDVNGDGFTDVILAGNEYQANVMTGRYDASYGLLLTADGKGQFNALPPIVSGLIIDGDVKDLKIITAGKQKILLSAINDSKMKAFAIRKK
jgi:hypothetical protein